MGRDNNKRIPEVKPLSEILPKGTEGGKEFSRLIDLLLFHQSRRSGKNLILFDDRSGDYKGLDALEKIGETYIGYQHKFYSSPLNSNHRSEIKRALRKTIRSLMEGDIKLAKWIIVTPDDFTESARKKNGGDVSWFQNLTNELNIPFEIEHWGHKQIIGLFLETSTLGLYYYPILYTDGIVRKKSINDIRSRYDEAYKSLYQSIEFVGMSVYKEESTRGVPMEDIYIPLNTVPNNADDINEDIPHHNPINFLQPNSKTIILGDPGSGKTTLLKFLGLIGSSKKLQKKYGKSETNFIKDERLPVLITLRRFADELKKDANLCIVEYIRRNIEGDFSINGVSNEFLEYYLETGNTILLFDGMDELPDQVFKKSVRDKIQALSHTYPGNTIIVTTRIVGYGGVFRFNEQEFQHYRLTNLRIEEIEQFISDWYSTRISNKKDCSDHIKSLISILRNDDHKVY